MPMQHIHVGDRVIIFERSQGLRDGMPAKGRYVARTVQAKKAGRVYLDNGRSVLPKKVIAIELSERGADGL